MDKIQDAIKQIEKERDLKSKEIEKLDLAITKLKEINDSLENPITRLKKPKTLYKMNFEKIYGKPINKMGRPKGTSYSDEQIKFIRDKIDNVSMPIIVKEFNEK